MSMGKPGDVLEITVLKGQPREDEALLLLKKIASLVRPIMKAHGWILPTLAEFYPKQTNLLGVNINGGKKICIRLRPAGDANSFLGLDDSLLGTMLHELTHNVRGPHDEIFYKQLDALWEEMDALRAKGYEGEGFLGKGNRVGLGVAHDTGVSIEEARRRALKKFEERDRVARLLGKGGKLGGSKPDMKGKRMGDILAEAADRRMRDAKACGHSDEHEKLPPELQAEVDRSARDSRSVMIDLTQESDEDDLATPQAAPSDANRGSEIKIKAEPMDDSSPDLEILPPKIPTKRPAASPPATSAIRSQPPAASTGSSSASGPNAPVRRPDPPAPKAAAPATWTCPTCTFIQSSPLSLACECCLTERPYEATIALATSAPKRVSGSAGGTIELDEGWACHRCLTLNDHQFWTCAMCEAVKQSSARG